MWKNAATDRRLVALLWSITLLPVIITVFTELNKTRLVWYIRVVDFFDLVILGPFFLISLAGIHRIVYREESHPSSFLSLVLIGIFMYGHAMHLTGNTINTYSTEIQQYGSLIPGDTYDLIYFFDEILGHILLYVALFALIGLWSFEYRIESEGVWSITICGILFGLTYAVALIESSQPWLGPLAFSWIFVCNLYKTRKQRHSLRYVLKHNLLTQFAMSAAIALLFGQLAYVVVVGSFTQPSQIGL